MSKFSDVYILVYRYDQCGCVDPHSWSSRFVVRLGTKTAIVAPFCNTSDVCHIDVMKRFRSNLSMRAELCSECRGECDFVRFETKLSSFAVPADSTLDHVRAILESSNASLPSDWSNTWPVHVQKNFVRLLVQCESLLVEHYNQTPSLSKIDVLSNIGGHTGLWIGISFLSLMELVELACRLIRSQYHLLRRRMRRTTRVANNE